MPFPFLRLPSEFRITIYRLLLHFTLPIRRGIRPPESAVLRSCRQMHYEGLPILYGENTFEAHPTLLTATPLAGLERILFYPPPPGLITKWSITLRLDVDTSLSAEDMKLCFSGSDYLEIEVTQSQFGSSDYASLELFLGVRGVGKAFVHGSVSSVFSKWLEQIMMASEGSDLPPIDQGLIQREGEDQDNWTFR